MRGILVTILIILVFGGIAIMLWLKERKSVNQIGGKIDTYFPEVKERRRSIRFNRRLDVNCKVAEKPDSRWSIFSKNISGEGICIVLPEILPVDADVDLEIAIPQIAHPLNVNGKVVWVKEIGSPASGGRREFNAGVKFTNIKAKDEETLKKFISEEIKKKGAVENE